MVDRAQYEAQGFVHVPGVCDAETVERLRAEAERLISERGSGRPWDGDWKPQDVTYRLTTVKDVHRHSELFRECGESPQMRSVIEALIGPCQLVAGMLIVKPPEDGQPFPLHQDSAYYSPKEHEYVIATLHLDATTSENGALRFLPGYHREGALPHWRQQKASLDPKQYRMEDTVEVCAAAGDLVCFNIHTPHASHPNTTAKQRALVRYGYVPAKAKK